MPWWLTYYVETSVEIRMLFGTFAIFTFASFLIFMMDRKRKLGYFMLFISVVFWALVFLLPNGYTATTIYNSLN